MSAKIRLLQARKAGQVQAARAFNDATDTKAQAESRGWSEEESKQYKSLEQAATITGEAIDREQVLSAQEAGLPAPVAAGASHVNIPANAVIHTQDNRECDPTHGFKSFGAFAKSVVNAGLNKHDRPDDRLFIGAAAPGTVSNEATGADGGFVVPPQYSSDVFKLSLGEDSLLPMTDNVDISSNSMVFPKTEQTPWGSNGVRAYWQAEAAAATATKVTLGTQALRLHKLMALIPLSDELVADTNALNSLVPGLIGDSIRWKTNEAILFGNGNGQPLGALASSGPVVTQAKDTGQATNTLSVLNLFNMISRLPPNSFTRAIWLLHPTVLPALATLVLGQTPVFVAAAPAAAGALTNSVSFGYILGRPVIISHHCAVFSTAGDVQLHDLSYYRTITKAGGIQTDTSMHLYFDADAIALRATFRVDGGPKIAAAISPAKGSTTLSPFIQLGAR
jgi:HK97 family phage major capsid protein